MNPLLDKHFAALQTATDALLKDVMSLSASTYHLQPANDKWSIAQILAHLLTSERLSLNYMKKKAMTPVETLGEAGFYEDVLFLVLKISQRVPLRYKAPRVVVENTPATLSFGDLVREWDITRLQMREFLEQLPPELVRKKIYRHPYAVRLSVVHALRFLTEHIRHHQPQVHRIIIRKKIVRAGCQDFG